MTGNPLENNRNIPNPFSAILKYEPTQLRGRKKLPEGRGVGDGTTGRSDVSLLPLIYQYVSVILK